MPGATGLLRFAGSPLGWGLTALRAALPPLTLAMFALLAVALPLDRFPLPGGDSFSYRSLTRNLVIVACVGHLIGCKELRFVRSLLGAPLLACLGAAALSVAVNRGTWGDVRTLATAVGLFFVVRAIGARPSGPAWLLHWLGSVAIVAVAREVLHGPHVLLLREAHRLDLVTDHANTLGYWLALLVPLFLGRAMLRKRRALPALYAACAAFGVLITFSRAAWASVGLGLLAFALASRPRRPSLRAVLLVAAAVTAVAAVTGYLSLERTEADWQRLRIITASLSLFSEHWLVGVGFGIKNLEQVFPARYIELYGASLFLYHSHNFFVDALVGMGVIGAGAAAWLAWRLLRLSAAALRAAPEIGRTEALSYVISIATFLAIAMVDMPLSHGKLMMVFVVTWALIESRVANGAHSTPASPTCAAERSATQPPG